MVDPWTVPPGSGLDLLALLVAGHLLADFALQPIALVRKKAAWKWLLIHGGIVLGAHGLVLAPIWRPSFLPVLALLALFHVGLDRWKGREPSTLRRFLADQALHLFSLAAVWGALGFGTGPSAVAFAAWPLWFWGVCLLAGYAFVWTGGAAIVQLLLADYDLEGAGGTPSSSEARGRIIGVLERLVALTLILLGQWGALAVVIAAKSIARFKELEDRDFSERYLIGTLSSLLVAMATGLVLLLLWGAGGAPGGPLDSAP